MTVNQTQPVSARPAGGVPTRPPAATTGLSFKDAFVKAADFTGHSYGPDFKPVMAFGNQAFSVTGSPTSATWRFNMVGHLPGSSEWSAVKVNVAPDGTVALDPKWGPPSPDNLDMHTMPVLDMQKVISPEQGMAQVMKEAAKQYTPQHPISWEVGQNDRLNQVVETFYWRGKDTRDGTIADCEESIDPTTGAIVEVDADPVG